MLPVVVVAVAAIIIFAVVRAGNSGGAGEGIGQPVPQDVMTALQTVPDSVFNDVGTAGAVPPVSVPPTDPVNAASPVVMYIGAEYCPFCASQRWPLVVALERFGDFSGLKLSASASDDVYPDTPTVSFHGSSYTSEYLSLQTVETAGRTRLGNQYNPLETMNSTQNALFRKYNAPPYVDSQSAGAIPFLLIGQTYQWVGSTVAMQNFNGQTWQLISQKVSNPQDPLGKAIVANANMITAAICKLNGGRPDTVCTQPGVQAAAQLLPAQK